VSALLAYISSPDRGVWHLGAIPIRAYALCIIVGIVVAIWWGERRLVARGGEPGTITDIALFAVPFGLVGGRLYHVLTDWSKYFGSGGHPGDALKIWQGGLGIWGAISLGALGAWIGARRKGVPLTVVADACAPGIVAAQAIGRLGNWFNQELFGGPTTLPWGLKIFQRVDPDTGVLNDLTGISNGQLVGVYHPTFLYELLWDLAVAALCVLADRRFRMGRGRVFALYVAGYTFGRFWIELIRTDPATMVFGVRINVITSVVVFAAAVAYLVLVRGPRENLAVEAPEVAAETPAEASDAPEEMASVPAGAGEARAAGNDAPTTARASAGADDAPMTARADDAATTATAEAGAPETAKSGAEDAPAKVGTGDVETPADVEQPADRKSGE
jgi:prolipoprotein diacylglyceryl transferase